MASSTFPQDDGGLGSLRQFVEPVAAPPDEGRQIFRRGRQKPEGVRWYGVRSFWGHIQHFIASAIATEDIDSRDWMRADDPAELVSRAARVLGSAPDTLPDPGSERSGSSSLTSKLERDVWIDFVADTGDDADVSRAVAEIIFGDYRVPDPDYPGELLEAPRGDILLFGGDTAYPVATADEIHDRVVVPFNQVLQERGDHTPRVLLGIPGNHDWYDGLDGFGRMFRRQSRREDLGAKPSLRPKGESRLVHVTKWAGKFVEGGHVAKARVLMLAGYEPIQAASYFVLPLAPGFDLLGVDRQLRSIDYRQREYFHRRRCAQPKNCPWVLLPDPVYAFQEPSRTGVGMARALQLDLEEQTHLVLAGDIHHYQRRQLGKSLHITSGGGGAFLHPARIGPGGGEAPARQWPGQRFSKAALWQVPLQVALGRAGFLPHLLLMLAYAPAILLGWSIIGTPWGIHGASAIAGIGATVICGFIGGWRRDRVGIILFLAGLTGLAMTVAPSLSTAGVAVALKVVGWPMSNTLHALVVLFFAVGLGLVTFGAYLAALTLTGLENTQAFTALGHPGFKHFLKIRVRKDGSRMDVWALGKVDPLNPEDPVVLVDRFTFRPEPHDPSRVPASVRGGESLFPARKPK